MAHVDCAPTTPVPALTIQLKSPDLHSDNLDLLLNIKNCGL